MHARADPSRLFPRPVLTGASTVAPFCVHDHGHFAIPHYDQHSNASVDAFPRYHLVRRAASDADIIRRSLGRDHQIGSPSNRLTQSSDSCEARPRTRRSRPPPRLTQSLSTSLLRPAVFPASEARRCTGALPVGQTQQHGKGRSEQDRVKLVLGCEAKTPGF
jgi:hypothetical protein